MTYKEDYRKLKKLAAITHGSINISGGIKFQKLIFEAIVSSKKHDEVYHDYPVSLIKETGEEDRDEHDVDILCVNSDIVVAANSKGKSFNNTETGYGLLTEYRGYKKSLEKKFPGKKVEYIILKDEYDPSDPKMSKYNYLVNHGIPVYNTEQYLIDNYGTDFKTLEETRQQRAVERCRDQFVKFGISKEDVDAILDIMEKLN